MSVSKLTAKENKQLVFGVWPQPLKLIWRKVQYSCLENPMDEEPNGLQSMGSQSQTWLSMRTCTHTHTQSLHFTAVLQWQIRNRIQSVCPCVDGLWWLYASSFPILGWRICDVYKEWPSDMSSCPRKCWLHKRRPGDKREMPVWILTRDTRSREHKLRLVETGRRWSRCSPGGRGSKQSLGRGPRTGQGSCEKLVVAQHAQSSEHSEGHSLAVTTLCPWGLRVCTGITHIIWLPCWTQRVASHVHCSCSHFYPPLFHKEKALEWVWSACCCCCCC